MTSNILSTRLLALAVGVSPLALAIAQASAAAVTISSNQTTTVRTSTADAGAPGDVTLTGTVKVGAGTAVIVDSNNSFTSQNSVQSEANTGGVGIQVNTSAVGATLTSTITNSSSIILSGTNTSATPGIGNTGVLINGTGVLNGDFVSGTSSTMSIGGNDGRGLSLTANMVGNISLYGITAGGDRSRGVSITGNLTGDTTLNGTISVTGASGVGVYVAGDVQGSLYNSGTINTGTGLTYDNNGRLVAAVAGKADVVIAGNLSEGFLNDRYYLDSNNNKVYLAQGASTTGYTAVVGSLSAVGGGKAILVTANREEGPLGDVVLGDYGTGNLAYAIVNRGTISAAGTNNEVAANAIRIEGATINATTYHTIVGSGLANLFDGTITAFSTDAAATGISIGANATVPTIRNDGTINVYTNRSVDKSANPTGPGGAATAVLIEADATVNAFTNSGTMTVSTAGAATSAYGVRDLSGSITSFTNSGTMTMTRSTGNTGGLIAADLSHGVEDIHFVNSGTITGDVALGAGDNLLELTGGTLTGILTPGSGNSTAIFSGAAKLVGGLDTSAGQLALTMGGTSQVMLTGNYQLNLSSLTLQDSAVLQVAVDGSGTPGITVAGNAVLSDDSRLAPFISGVIRDTQTITILTAANLTVDDPANVVSLTVSPYMYEVSGATVGSNSISLDLRRKNAAELGLGAATGALYENSLDAFDTDQALAQAISNQPTQATFAAAYRQLEPPSFGTAITQTALAMQNATFGALSHRLGTLNDIKRAEEGEVASHGFWVQELGAFYNQKDKSDSPGFSGHTYGVALGIDKALFGLDAFGLGFSQSWSDIKKDGTFSKPLKGRSSQFDLYAAWSKGGLFVNAFGAWAFNNYDSKRTVAIDSLSRTANAKWGAKQLSGNLIAGYQLHAGNFSLTPSASLAYMRLNQKGYTETGGQGIDLVVDSATNNSLRGGGKLTAAYMLVRETARFKFETNIGMSREFKDAAPMTTARFAAAGNSFTMTGAALSKSILQGGLGLTYMTSISSLSFNYDYQSQGDFKAHGVTATFRIAF